ncbi:alpha/beta hydrolase [Tenacibaculum ovolyticum]|uniref:alpha/beta fold hydrolase n=1 Tax=Tenacibaculum ovolyticum TaxID=104270 RepID=UPI0022F40090|nr:alpha/beta hydrolase [Tenacibaculum ovolyticum]WBX77689.1 alpha/beta hydrolase [Tenacibaculum ovolyticum]
MIEYNNIAVQKIKVNGVTFGLRQVGSGDDLVLIHGFPTHGYTWRKILPQLSEKFRCHIFDLPGLGDSEWRSTSNLNIDVQAINLTQILNKLGVDKFNLLAHNSGGTIARLVAIQQPDSVKNLILINTEIPNHRPPFIELFQRISRLPFSSFHFKKKLSQLKFVKSSMGFKQAYYDRTMLDDNKNLGPYLNPLIKSRAKVKGAFRFLRGIDWKLIDGFAETHKNIKANVLFIWGENDKTFPIGLGKEMINQFTSKVEFKTISKASLLPHEEKPDIVAQEVLKFIS